MDPVMETEGPVMETEGPAMETEGPAMETEGTVMETEGLAKDDYESDPELLARVTFDCIRKGIERALKRANKKNIAVKKRRRKKRNRRKSFRVRHETNHSSQDQPNSSNNSNEESLTINFEPSYLFRNLLYRHSNNEAEKILCGGRIFHSNLPMGVRLEDKHIHMDIRYAFGSGNKLRDYASPTETLNLQQTVDKDVFQKPSHQDNMNCYDWDKFLEKWEGVPIDSEPTSKVQHHEHKTIDELEDCLPSKRRNKRKEKSVKTSSQSIPFKRQVKKRCRIADNLGTAISTSSPSTSSNTEHSLNRNSVLSSFDKRERICSPVSMDVLETSIASKLEEFIKNTKIELLEDSETPPFTKKFTALDDESLPNIDEIAELTGVEWDDDGDIEMISWE